MLCSAISVEHRFGCIDVCPTPAAHEPAIAIRASALDLFHVAARPNPLAHAVVRGAVDREGKHIPNYHYEDLIDLSHMYENLGLENPAIIVDTNHSNSGKKFKEQPRIAMEVMRSREHSRVLKRMVRGLMIESYLVEGSQDSTGKAYGKSITDPCLGWDESEQSARPTAEVCVSVRQLSGSRPVSGSSCRQSVNGGRLAPRLWTRSNRRRTLSV